ncbi:MAG TPA: hypothetical protein VFM37_13265 [Pseudonocardiaceae bacterium]|nr:hypothetical protein [Pseudonocardiaceae bacterium]
MPPTPDRSTRSGRTPAARGWPAIDGRSLEAFDRPAARGRYDPLMDWPQTPDRHEAVAAPARSPAATAPDPDHAEQPVPARQHPGPARQPGRPSRGWRLPGLGFLLTLVAIAILVVSFTVLPWAGAAGFQFTGDSLPELANRLGTNDFAGWYVVLFSYPLAALGVLLALVSVLQSAVTKIIWGALVLLGLGGLVLRYGLGPFTDLAADGGLRFSRVELTVAMIALAALVVVIFLLRLAVTTFRRVAGVILLGFAGLHSVALWDLLGSVGTAAGIAAGTAGGSEAGTTALSFGAFGPALGYLLTAIAAFIGPGRLLGR